MILNISLAIFAIAGIGILWYRISHKIPELVAIPDEVIVMRLNEDSARVRIFLLHLRTFWREPRYQEAFWRFCEKSLYRAHIVLMRADNGLAVLLRTVRSHAGVAAAIQEAQEEATSAVVIREEISVINLEPKAPMPRRPEDFAPATLPAVRQAAGRREHTVESKIAQLPRKSNVRIREVRPRRKTTSRTAGLQG